MNNFLDDNNVSYQKLDSSISNNNIEIELVKEKGDKTFDHNFILNGLYKDKEFLKLKTLIENEQIIPYNLSELNTRLFSSSENNISIFYEDVFPMFNKKNCLCSNKEKKIFEIVKKNKKIGRIKKNSSLKGVHNRLCEDNIIRKIKGRFTEKLRLYINNEYQNYLLNKGNKKRKKGNWLKKINPNISRKIRKEENIKWFNAKIYEIFSENLSLRYSSQSPDLNKKKIDTLISLNKAKNVIEILNSNIELLFNKYVNNEQIEGFKTLKDDIKELEIDMKNSKQENIKEYLNKYEYVAQNMKNIFERKNGRNNGCQSIFE